MVEVMMNYRKPTLVFDSLLVFSVFMSSNITALFSLLWLLPDVVMMEAVLWAALAIAALWAVKAGGTGESYRSALRLFRFFLPFLVYSGISVFWSVFWEVSLGRWLVLIAATICGLYLGVRYTFRQIIRFLAMFSVFLLAVSGFYIVFYSDIGVMNYYIIQGAWKGIFWHKNHLGMVAAFSTLLCLLEAILARQAQEKGGTAVWGALCLASLMFVIKSDSAAGLMITIALFGLTILGIVWLKFKKRLTARHYAAIAALSAVVLVAMLTRLDVVFNLFNRNTTLTGRIPMWDYLFSAYFSQRPLWGYGFNAFWYIESHQVAVQAAAGYPDPIIISDNGFIDILINTGVFGFTLFAVFYFDLWRRTVSCAFHSQDVTGLLPFLVMAFILLANVSWSVLFENENFFMLIMLSILASFPRRDADGDRDAGKRLKG